MAWADPVAMVIVAALIGFFIYMELKRSGRLPSRTQSADKPSPNDDDYIRELSKNILLGIKEYARLTGGSIEITTVEDLRGFLGINKVSEGYRKIIGVLGLVGSMIGSFLGAIVLANWQTILEVLMTLG